MEAVTHSLGGVTIGIILANAYPGTYAEHGVLIGSAIVGSLLPDIDYHKSYISSKAVCLRAGVGLIQAIVRFVAEFLPAKGEKHVKSLVAHRGIAHSLLFAVAMAILAGSISKWCAIGIASGIMSHLVLDIFSGGVPLFIPLTTKRVCFARIKTGGVIECGIRILWVLIPVGILYKRFLG